MVVPSSKLNSNIIVPPNVNAIAADGAIDTMKVPIAFAASAQPTVATMNTAN